MIFVDFLMSHMNVLLERLYFRVCVPPEHFLVLVYSPLHSKPEFYEFSTCDGKPDLQVALYTTHASLILPNVSTISKSYFCHILTVAIFVAISYSCSQIPTCLFQSNDDRPSSPVELEFDRVTNGDKANLFHSAHHATKGLL